MAEHKIVIASVRPGSEAAVADALSRALGVELALTQQIARSTPIVILDKLVPEQAAAIEQALGPVTLAGANLTVSAAAADSMPQVSWPSPPTVAGRDLDSYRPGAGGPGRTPSPAPMAPVSSAPAAATPVPVATPTRPAETNFATRLTCPHCKGFLYVQIAGVAPLTPDAAGSSATGSHVPISRPMDLEEFEKGVGGGGPSKVMSDDLLRQLDASLPQKGPAAEGPRTEPAPSPPALPAKPPQAAQRGRKAGPQSGTGGDARNRPERGRRRPGSERQPRKRRR